MIKKESTLLNMTVTLIVVTVIISTSVGFMYQLTKEPIAAANAVKLNLALKAVLPEYDNNPLDDAYEIDNFDAAAEKLICFPGSINGELSGIAVRTWTNSGFSGMIRIMVGFDPSGKIVNISVLEQKETPGLGTKITNPRFKDQYTGKNPGTNNLKMKKEGGEIDAITAATISSRAFSEAVERAYKSLEKGGKFE
jgi:electron transport complex protein RnfG